MAFGIDASNGHLEKVEVVLLFIPMQCIKGGFSSFGKKLDSVFTNDTRVTILMQCIKVANMLDFARNFDPSSITMQGLNKFVTTPTNASHGSLLTYGYMVTKMPTTK